MSRFSQVSKPHNINITYKQEAQALWSKRDKAFNHVVLTSEDTDALDMLDGKKSGLNAFLASNFRGRLQFARALSRDVQHIATALPDTKFLHVTIINGNHETSDEHTVLPLKQIADEARDILGAMTPNFLAGIELASFANRRHHDGGKVISPHVHAVLWGHDIMARSDQVAHRYNARLETGVAGAEAVKVQLVRATPEDLERVVAYPYRPPVRTKTVYLNPRTGRTNLHESEKGDRYVRFLRLFQLHSLMQQDHLCFAGGDGVRTRRNALKAVHDRLALTARRCSRAAQMQWIEEFWCEFMPRIGHGRFEMPNIITR